jgi:hypothetical protein
VGAEVAVVAVQHPFQTHELDQPARSRVDSWYRASVVHPGYE